jgi:hypothetical protein
MPPTQDVSRSIVDDFSTEEDDEPDDNRHLLSKTRSGTRKPPGPVSILWRPEHNILTVSIAEKNNLAVMVIKTKTTISESSNKLTRLQAALTDSVPAMERL